MSRQQKDRKSPAPDLDQVGGLPALNFINTLRADGSAPLETLHTDSDVRAWMSKMKFPEPVLRERLPDGVLLESARMLRSLALSAMEQRKLNRPVSLTALNRYLSQSMSHVRVFRSEHSIEARREYSADSAEQFLAPIAEAIADCLTTADFSLIRKCEGSGCVLWFSDRPNGRPRRFCTEETCGTRMRVAAFRARAAQRSPLQLAGRVSG